MNKVMKDLNSQLERIFEANKEICDLLDIIEPFCFIEQYPTFTFKIDFYFTVLAFYYIKEFSTLRLL